VVQRSNNLPAFDERFEDYGMNKISFVMEVRMFENFSMRSFNFAFQLVALGYRFVVMTHAWALHQPHESSKMAKAFDESIELRMQNRAMRC
jgi:hypothetical protein